MRQEELNRWLRERSSKDLSLDGIKEILEEILMIEDVEQLKTDEMFIMLVHLDEQQQRNADVSKDIIDLIRALEGKADCMLKRCIK